MPGGTVTFVILNFFSGLVEPFILHVVLWVRNLGKAPLGSLSAWLHVGQRGLGDSLPRWHLCSPSDVSAHLGFSCCPPGASDHQGSFGFSGTVSLS